MSVRVDTETPIIRLLEIAFVFDVGVKFKKKLLSTYSPS